MADKKPDNQKNAENQKKQAEIAKKQAEAKARKAKKQDEGADEEVVVSEPAPPARLSIKYRQEIVPALQAKLGVKNIYAVPKLEKIVISMGVGRFATEGGEGKAKMEKVEKELSVIAGQKPLRCKAKKSVANYKVREGQETGLKVTLRGTRMYEFLDRMITLAFPA